MDELDWVVLFQKVQQRGIDPIGMSPVSRVWAARDDHQPTVFNQLRQSGSSGLMGENPISLQERSANGIPLNDESGYVDTWEVITEIGQP
jgi:hypothetical protein